MSFNPKEHMMNLKGKEYLQVMWRLVWFRDDHPNWNIDTCIVSLDENQATFVCKIYDDTGKQLSSGHGSESKKDFNDFMEKAETKSIGRALAILGYGTQFAPEMDEQERIVDSPVTPKNAPTTAKANNTNNDITKAEKPATPPSTPLTKPTELEYVITDGEFKGKTIAEIYKLKKVIDLIADANARKDKTVIDCIRTVNKYIEDCKK